MAADILKTLLVNTLVFSALFGIMLLVRRAFARRISAFLRYMLWAFVVIKLVIPFGFESALSPLGLFPSPPSHVETPAAQQTPLPADNAAAQGITTANDASGTPSVDTAYQPPQAAQTQPTDTASAISLDWTGWALIVWLAGVAAMALWLGFCMRRLRRRILHSRTDVPGYIESAFEACREELGISRYVRLTMQSAVSIPFITGILKPVLILPDSLRGRDENYLRHIFIHELVHYRHRDLLVIHALNALNCVYWFNPLMWLCFSMIRSDMETICDQSCLRLAARDGRGYVETVLGFAGLSSESRRLNAALSISDGRSSMEKRIRDMFRTRKTGRRTRALAGFIAALMLAACLLTACQPTPGKAAVLQKGSNAAGANTVLYSKSDFPNSYKDTFSKNGANIVFDAAVELPETESLPTYKISPAVFTQDQTDSIIKALFKGRQMYAPAEVTKSELEPEYIKALADLKAKQDNPDQYEASEQYYQDQVDEIKQEIANAPETDTLKPVGSELVKSTQQGTSYYSGRGDLGKDKMATLSIDDNTGNPVMGDNSFLWFFNGSRYDDASYFYPDRQDDGPSNLKVTKEQAIAMADDIVTSLGAVGMKYAGCATGILDDTDHQSHGYPADFDPQIPQAYLIYYTRNLSGVPVTYDLRNSSNDSADDSYAAPAMYERITVAVDDGGVSYINWQGPVNIDGVSSENNKIIPFGDIISLAKDQLSFSYAVYDNAQPKPSGPVMAQASSPIDNGKILSNDIHIQRVTLGFMQIPVKNENRSELVPVWDFFGYYETGYQSGAKAMHYKNGKSLLTVNAINGSIINRDQGY